MYAPVRVHVHDEKMSTLNKLQQQNGRRLGKNGPQPETDACNYKTKIKVQTNKHCEILI